MRARGAAVTLGLALMLAWASAPVAAGAPDDALHRRYAELAERLSANQFGRPLLLESHQHQNHVQGDVYALVEHPLKRLRATLGQAQQWCEVLLRQASTQSCSTVSTPGQPALLRLQLASPATTDAQRGARLEFNFLPLAASAAYFETVLDAPPGPLGASGYRLVLRALALADGRSLLHFSYAYDMNFGARLASRAYQGMQAGAGLALTSQRHEDAPFMDDRVRHMVERNTLRYYLALDAYLSAAPGGPAPNPGR